MLCEHGNIAPCVECDVEPLKAENDALRARVAQLESATLTAIQLMPGGQAKADLRDAYDEEVPAIAWLLRKQAAAVDDIRKDLLSDLPVHAISKAVDLRLGLRVDSLREKAAEADRAGGEQ